MKNFLVNKGSVTSTYVGFESQGMCMSPIGQYKWIDPSFKQDRDKCDLSDTGFYTPICRPWYKKQKANPNKTIMNDLYQFSSGLNFGMTFCVPLEKMDQYYATLCYDINTAQDLIPF